MHEMSDQRFMTQTHAHLDQESKMADGDEEDDLVALGTPFEQLEEDAPRKKPVPIHEQVVTDDRGRRRFHGAFTGGFSAGYFNTVDTKEGWTPKTFISSRSQKASDRFTQRPEDFMDEEDLGEFGIAPKRVVTTEKFLPSGSDGSTSGKRASASVASGVGGGGAGSAVLRTNLLQDLIVPVKMSVGIKLLSQMGWKEGQGVGPRVRREAKKTYGCIGPPGTGPDTHEEEEDIYSVGLFFAPKDVESFEFTSKDDLHGIGYSGIDPKTALLSQTDWLGMGTSASSIGIRGQGFGVGALEEDDEDIYAQDNLSKYDIELSTSKAKSQRRNDLHGWSGPQQSSGQGGMLSIFCKASKPPPARKHYPPPVVPRDFKPFHKTEDTTQPKQLSGPPVNQGQKTQQINQASKRLTAKERGEALGEVPLPTPTKSIFDYIAEEDKTRLKESKERANTSKKHSEPIENNDLDRRFTSRGPLSTSGFKPFAKEPEKQARYEKYLSGKSDKDMSSQTDSKMTEWERECELEEFSRAAALYRPLSQTMAARFTSANDTDDKPSVESGKKDQSTAAKMKMFGALTRERFEWHPDRILCKRFNIPDPYPGSGVTGVVMNRREKHKSDEPVVIREVKAIDFKPHSREPDDETAKSSEHEVEAEVAQKPSALVAGFQSIVSQRKQPSYQDTSTGSSGDRAEKETQNKLDQDNDADVVKRAPMDLFNEIFAESSSESESESEENEQAEQPKTVERDVRENEERNDESIEKKNVRQTSDSPVLVPEESTSSRSTKTLEREKEPSPETFGPVLPSSFSGTSATTSKGSYFSTRVDSPRRQEKQKRKKKKRREDRGTDSDVSDSEDGYSRRKRDKKKRSKKKEGDLDSDEEYRNKKGKKKTKGKDTDSVLSDTDEKDIRKKKKKKSSKYTDNNLSDSENEEYTRNKKKKARSRYSDSDEKYEKQKKSRRGKDDSDGDDSSNEEYTKHRKKKRKNKEKSAKERKKYSDKTNKSDGQEYEEIQYVEKVARNIAGEQPLSTFESPGSSGHRKSNYHEKIKNSSEQTSKNDARNSNSRADDSTKEQESSKVPESKEIINKLKNIQMLKEKKRMRAADFM